MRKSFPLIELLVVVTILLPALQSARDSAKVTVCLSNVRQIATVISSCTLNASGLNAMNPGVWGSAPASDQSLGSDGVLNLFGSSYAGLGRP